MAAWMALTRWLLFASLLAIIGAVSTRWLILPRSVHQSERPPVARLLAVSAAGASALLASCLAAVFAGQLFEFHDPFAPLADDARILLGTAWGTAWKLGLVGSLLALVAFSWAARSGTPRRAGSGADSAEPEPGAAQPEAGQSRGAVGHGTAWLMASVLALALAFFPAFTGHAVASPVGFAVIADGLHVLAAGTWMGSLFMLLMVAGWLRPGAGGLGPARTMFPAFAPIALTAAAILLATGAFAAYLHIPSVSALFSTGYGLMVVAKAILAVVIAGQGARNWRRNVPRLAQAGAAGGLRRGATLEWLLSHVVLAVTAWLVHTAPPGP